MLEGYLHKKYKSKDKEKRPVTQNAQSEVCTVTACTCITACTKHNMYIYVYALKCVIISCIHQIEQYELNYYHGNPVPHPSTLCYSSSINYDVMHFNDLVYTLLQRATGSSKSTAFVPRKDDVSTFRQAMEKAYRRIADLETRIQDLTLQLTRVRYVRHCILVTTFVECDPNYCNDSQFLIRLSYQYSCYIGLLLYRLMKVCSPKHP